ncbi:MAG: DEAD/DEAH box helicase [Pirellulales bacterium]
MAANATISRQSSRKKSKRRKARATKLSRTNKPAGMNLDEWQIALRRQFGREQSFKIRNLGAEPVFSEFQVTNPASKSTYRVAIRGTGLGDNFCSCADFATNTLGTCKHVEFTLAWLRRRRGVKRVLAAGFQPAYSEVYLRYGAQREVRLRLGTDCPPRLARLTADYFDEEGRLPQEAFGSFDEFLAKTAKIDHELRVYDDALGLIAEVRDAQRRKEILAKAFPRGIRSAALKNLVKAPLYEYQREGALFAARAGRSLIGDEMGLGKTIQALAAVEIMARHFGVERVLVVSPTSLKHQWEREIGRFVDRSARVIGGFRAQREADFAEPSFYKLTNYEAVRRDLDLIAQWAPDVVILDEAQRIKNWNTQTARAVKRIVSPHAIVLTGTPLENRLEELVSLVQFVDRHRVGPTFKFLDEHQVKDETGRVIGYRRLDGVAKTLEPILIRRRKEEVLKQLPGRLEKRFFVPMTPLQWKHHQENCEIVAKVVAKWRRYGFLSESDQRRLMIALQNMRMSCDSTYLLDHESDHGSKADELATLLEEIHEEPDIKVVIFSQWVRMLELVERRFARRKWDYVLFHGGVPVVERKKLVDRFREEPRCRSFLSTDAGGVGLNLQHASVVVNLDLPWNPAVLEQRIGRVHRLGQTRPVRAIHFVAQGTIEEGMLSVLSFKKSLMAGILDGGEKEVFLGGSRLKRFMETVEKVAGAIPAAEPAAEPQPAEDFAPTNGDGEGSPRQIEAVAEERASEPRLLVAPPPTLALPSAARASVDLQSAAIPAEPLAALLQTGAALLQSLVASSAAASPSRGDGGSRSPVELVHRPGDESPYLQFRLPDREFLDRALGAVQSVLERLRE